MDLNAWNAALVADVLARPQPGQRLYLYVDRDSLARLSGLGPQEAVIDFRGAFRAQAQSRPFYRGARLAQHWRTGGFRGDPPFLAHLAMTVLAVTEQPLGRGGAVYPTQNELLGCPPEARAPQGYGEDVPVMWATWNAWLEGPGACFGRSSARTRPPYTLQGWARSQGLIRHRDRRLVERFVQGRATALALRPPTVSDLMVWLAYRGAKDRELLARVEDQAALDVLADVLEDEVARFQKEGARPPESLCRQGLLSYDDWEHCFGAVVPVDPEWHDRELDLGGGSRLAPDPFTPELQLELGVADDTLLDLGVEHHLCAGVSVRVGGRRVYAMRDHDLGGRVQCLSLPAGAPFHLLAHEARRRAVAEVLAAAGSSVMPRASTVTGWWWFDGVRADLDDSQMQVLALSAAGTHAGQQLRLTGGLRLAPGVYLAGGEPDLQLPAGCDAVRPPALDGRSLAVHGAGSLVSISEATPDPGRHRVAWGRSELSFETVPFLREEAAPGGVHRALPSLAGPAWFGPALRRHDVTASLSGACLRGIDVPAALTVPWRGEGAVLALTEDGALLELRPRRAAWLARIGIHTGEADVTDVVRGSAERHAVVAVLARNHRTGIVHAREVPPAAVGHALQGEIAAPPVTSRDSRVEPADETRPDLVGELVAATWRWADRGGEGHDERARRALGRALTRPSGSKAKSCATTGAGHDPRASGPTQAGAAARLRADVVEGSVGGNPYDDVLAWLSEQEGARASLGAFDRTWAWLCARRGGLDLGQEARQALRVLESLGHVETDWERRQVATAAATLTSLPSADGLSVLTGCRPPRLLERLDDPEDSDEDVARGTSGWTVHCRTAVDQQHRPLGPTAVYVEWDSAALSDARTALDRLGVRLQGCVARVLLDLHPRLDDLAAAGEQLTASPGGIVTAWQVSRTGGGVWSPRREDTALGFYRYQLGVGRRYAWRGARGGLVRVEPVVGQWLARAAAGRTSLLSHRPADKELHVPAGAWLPPLLERALVMRSGLPARRVATLDPERRNPDGQVLAYENVDAASAGRVAALLGQELSYDYGELRSERWTTTRHHER